MHGSLTYFGLIRLPKIFRDGAGTSLMITPGQSAGDWARRLWLLSAAKTTARCNETRKQKSRDDGRRVGTFGFIRLDWSPPLKIRKVVSFRKALSISREPFDRMARWWPDHHWDRSFPISSRNGLRVGGVLPAGDGFKLLVQKNRCHDSRLKILHAVLSQALRIRSCSCGISTRDGRS